MQQLKRNSQVWTKVECYAAEHDREHSHRVLNNRDEIMVFKNPFKGSKTNQPQPQEGQAKCFRLVRYFTLTSLGLLVAVALVLTYFLVQQSNFFLQHTREEGEYFKQAQDGFARQQDDAAQRDLLTIHEAGNVNLAHLFENALWEKDFAPFVAKAQEISVDECRAIADVKDEKDGEMKPPKEKTECFFLLGKKFMGIQGFADLNAKVYKAMRKSTVFKIKVYDLRGITLYSSEPGQIGEDKASNAGWMRAAHEGKSNSLLTHRDKFNAFEGVVEKRDLIAIYLPVLQPGSDKIVGVFEVYSDVTPLLEQVKKTSAVIKKSSADSLALAEQSNISMQDKMKEWGSQTLTIELALMLVLFGVLLLIVRRADGVITAQASEGKKAEQALRESENRFRLMFERTADAQLLLDPGTGQFIDCNQATVDMLHCTDKEEIFLLSLAELSPSHQPDGRDSGEKATEMLATALRNGNHRFEWTHRSAHREDFPVEVLLTPMLHGARQLIITTWRDISERKQQQNEILRLNASLEERVEVRTAQLQAANQHLEAFSYSVSHDLRGPLSAINGFSGLLEKSLSSAAAGPLAERSGHYLARIRAGVKQMGELIDAMLSLAQVSRADMLWETVDLSSQAEALLLALKEREPTRAVQLQVETGLLAQGDPRLLKQVLDNLLCNAWKFTAKQACSCITVGQQKGSAGEAVYFVRDNGAGFDMAHAQKLFGAFQRLHTEAEFVGTGIGLATVQRIIARHGGRVWAEAARGLGATFYFTLGAAPA